MFMARFVILWLLITASALLARKPPDADAVETDTEAAIRETIGPATAPTTQPTTDDGTLPAPPPPAEAVVLPEVTFDQIALDDLIDYLRERDRAFQAIVSYAGADYRAVTIGELQLQNVTADDVLAAVAEAYPQVQVQKVLSTTSEGPAAGIWAIRVRPLDSIRTATFRLSEAVDTVNMDNPEPDERAPAVAEVVALLQSVVESEPTQVKPALKLHEPTEVLVVRGNSRQVALVKEALESLSTPPPAKQAKNFQQVIRTHLQRIAQLEPQAAQAQALMQERVVLEKENRRLAERVRELEKMLSVRAGSD